MKSPSAKPCAQGGTAAAESDGSLARAAAIVQRMRAALDWMIAHPDWEGGFALAMARLGFKGQRQGIGFRQAALSLSIEEKCAAARCALKEGLPKPRQAEAKRLAALWGELERQPDLGRSRPSEARWRELSRQVQLLIAARYSEYKQAQLQLYQSLAPLAAQEARQLCRNLSHLDDASQEGRLALLQAIDRIDSEGSFRSYARQWIRRRIRNFLLQQSVSVKAPINLVSETWRQRNAPPDPSGKIPWAAPLLDVGEAGTLRLDDLQGDRSGLADEQAEAPPDRAMQEEEQALLRRALATLTEPQRQALCLRYGLAAGAEPRTLAASAAVFGISRQQVFQREKRAMGALARELAPLAAERSR